MITTRPMTPARVSNFLCELGFGSKIPARAMAEAHAAPGEPLFFTPTVGIKMTSRPGRPPEDSYYSVLIKTEIPPRHGLTVRRVTLDLV